MQNRTTKDLEKELSSCAQLHTFLENNKASMKEESVSDMLKKYMDEKGKFDLSKADLIVYSHGEYHSMGEKLGTFGYSIKKKDTKKK